MAPKTSAPRRVVGYVRISRDRDNETSTESQQKSIQAWCEAHGHQLVHVVTEPGRSAYKASRTSRPGFREAANLIRNGAGDMMAVWKVDRACRNTLDLLQLVQDLESAGAEFASVTEQFDTSTPMGKAMMTIVGVLAELESAQKSERATEWHRHRRGAGAAPTGKAVLGYHKPTPNVLEPDPVVAPLVRQAAAAILDGASVRSQALMLNDAGVKVTHTGLRVALQSPTLIGMAVVSDVPLPRQGGVRQLDGAELVPGGWEPILDRDSWDSLGELLRDPARWKARTRSNRLRHALGPVARCHCGGAMHVHTDRWSKKSGTTEMRRLLCKECTTGIGYDAVEDAVTAAVLDLLDDDAWRDVRSMSVPAAEPPADDTAEREAVDAKLARMWDLVLDGKLDPEEYAEAKARWVGELGRRAAVDTDPVDLPDVDDVRAAWDGFSPAERLMVFRAVVRRLVIGPATRRGGRGVDLSRVDLELV